MSSNKRGILRKRLYFYYTKYRHFNFNHFENERASLSTTFGKNAKHNAGGGGRSVKIFNQKDKIKLKRLVNKARRCVSKKTSRFQCVQPHVTKAPKNLKIKCYKKQQIPTRTDQQKKCEIERSVEDFT